MSCTVIAAPLALGYIISAFAINVAAVTAAGIAATSELNEELSEENPIINHDENVCDDIKIISEATIAEKVFETPFADKNILIKTLKEHGIKNVTDNFDTISGEYDKYFFTFERENEQSTYSLKISYTKDSSPENTVNDLNSEYALNVQEDSYLNILEKLKENNMQIENEEVLDDNTIVLTINLEN